MTRKDYVIIASVLNKYRNSEANATIGSVTAMITVDLAMALRESNPNFDSTKFYAAVNREGDN